MITFYYIKVKSDRLKEELKKNFRNWRDFTFVAIAVYKDGRKEAFNGQDLGLTQSEINTFTQIIGIS